MPDTAPLYELFADGLRSRYGRVPTGVDGRTEWVSAGGGPLARDVENAVVLADSHGDVEQAARVLAAAVIGAVQEAAEALRGRTGTGGPEEKRLRPALRLAYHGRHVSLLHRQALGPPLTAAGPAPHDPT